LSFSSIGLQLAHYHPFIGFLRYWFIRVWLLFLLLIVVAGWFLGRNRARFDFHSLEATTVRITGISGPRKLSDYLFLAVFSLYVVFYVFMILYHEDFACYDCDQLMDYAAVGRRFPPPIWVGDRFFPLTFQEFHALQFFTRSPAGFHSFAVAELLVLLFFLFFFLRDWSVPLRVWSLTAAMLAPSFVIPFTGLIYPERNILFWIGILMFCLERSSSSRNAIYVIGCFVATHCLLYYKEPMVVFVVAYAISRLLLNVRLAWGQSRRSWPEFAATNAIPIGMMGIASIYTFFFLLFTVSAAQKFEYIHKRALDTRMDTIWTYIQRDWLLPIFCAVVFYRLVGFCLRKKHLDPLWDSLAFGAICYFLVLVGVRIYADWYLAFVDLIALLYLVGSCRSWLQEGSSVRTKVVIAASLLIVIHNAAYSTLAVVERKQVIRFERRLVDFLKSYKGSGDEAEIKLYFPFSTGYQLMELSSYLNYRGIPILGPNSPASRASARFAISGRGNFPGSRCVPYREYPCFHSDEAKPGSLIIVSPEDHPGQEEINEIRLISSPLLESHSASETSVSGRLLRLMLVFAREFGEFGYRGYPQPWWQLYVFRRSL
jgi:hypothetical protein